jgi:hypothetical protein
MAINPTVIRIRAGSEVVTLQTRWTAVTAS